MNPWTIIGWIIAGILVLAITLLALIFIFGVVVEGYAKVKTWRYDRRKAAAHKKKWQETRLTPPAAGQKWKTAKNLWIFVSLIYDGKVMYCIDSVQREVDLDAWQKLVDDTELALMLTGKK